MNRRAKLADITELSLSKGKFSVLCPHCGKTHSHFLSTKEGFVDEQHRRALCTIKTRAAKRGYTVPKFFILKI